MVEKKGVFCTDDGRQCSSYSISHADGSSAVFLDYGARLHSLLLPDSRNHKSRMIDVVLSYRNPKSYLSDPAYMGAIIGRYANRISGGGFFLEGSFFPLSSSGQEVHLHGGERGFHQVVWQASFSAEGDDLTFFYHSPDGEGGYPGNLDVWVNYRFTENKRLIIDYRMQSDALTPVNLTNHTYWNLRGEGNIYEHLLFLSSDRYLVTDEQTLPTGMFMPIYSNSPLNFSFPKPIGGTIATLGGLDHSFVLSDWCRKSEGDYLDLHLAAELYDPVSTYLMRVLTSYPSIQVYSSQYLNPSSSDPRIQPQAALCLEAQYFPDSVHHNNFPSTILQPGREYHERTEYYFINK